MNKDAGNRLFQNVPPLAYTESKFTPNIPKELKCKDSKICLMYDVRNISEFKKFKTS